LGLLTGAIRSLAVTAMAPADIPWESRESRVQAVVILLGVTVLFLLGVFPQVTHPLISGLSSLFLHLGQ
jgi:hypothetical protein